MTVSKRFSAEQQKVGSRWLGHKTNFNDASQRADDQKRGTFGAAAVRLPEELKYQPVVVRENTAAAGKDGPRKLTLTAGIKGTRWVRS